VKHALESDVLETAVRDSEAALPSTERLCREDGALFIINTFFNAKPGSALFFSKVGPLQKLNFTVIDHDDDKSAVVLPATPYAFIIKTKDIGPKNKVLSCVEFGVRTTDALMDMEDTIRQVYLPSLSKRQGDATDGDNLTSSVERFRVVLSQEIRCRRGQVKLKLPSFSTRGGRGATPSFAEIAEMESCVEDWLREVGTFLQAENAKTVPPTAGPLAEIAYWRDRNVALSGVHEQLQAPHVVGLVARLRGQDSGGLVGELAALQSTLLKQHSEAKDNVKFLSTLDRHFKVVHTGSFDQIKESLPSMLNAIRMVWVVSRSFNTDEKLVPLMERIAGEITRRVAANIRVSTILEQGERSAVALIEAAANVLTEWEAAYLLVREKINSAVSSGQPWEFDRRRLFGRSRYMAAVCEDLLEVTSTLEQFHRFLSPEVKTIVGKRASEVDLILEAVGELKEPFAELSFDVFDRASKESWGATMDQFRLKVGDMEDMCKKFIETAFQELRSAGGAFDLVTSFETIKSRGTINAHIAARYQDILQRFSEELEQLEELFMAGKSNPPKVKDYPTVAGAIAWATALYKRAKRTILKFRSRPGLLDSTYGDGVKAHYLNFARSVDTYVQALYDGWSLKAVDAVSKLKEPLLVPLAPPNAPQTGLTTASHHSHGSHTDKDKQPFFKPPYAVNFGCRETGDGSRAPHPAALVSMGAGAGSSLANRGHHGPASVNVLDIIAESRSLDAMGFAVPAAAVSLTLQSPQLRMHALDLDTCLNRLKATLASLSSVEEKLLASHIKQLLIVFQPGFTAYNWTSQRIPAFTAACNQAITTFEAALDAVHSHGTSMSGILEKISSTALFTVGDLEERTSNEPMGLASFVSLIEEKKRVRLADLSRDYESMTPLLLKVEEEVAGTNSGASPPMASYYAYWEAKVFNAVVEMVIRSLATFHSMLRSPAVGKGLLGLTCTFTGRELTVTPSLKHVTNTLTGVAKGFSEAARAFPRWMHDHEAGCGTCIASPPVVVSDDDEAVVVSFYDEVIKSPVVLKLISNSIDYISGTKDKADLWLETWRAFDKEEGLWSSKRKTTFDRLRKNNPPLVYYDQMLSRYEAMVIDVRSRETIQISSFLRLDGRSLATQVEEIALGWKADYALALHESSKELLDTMVARLDKQRAECLGTETSDLETLKMVLNMIAAIEAEQMDVELNYAEIVERYRTLAAFGSQTVDAEEHELASTLPQRSRQLFVDAKTKDLRLVDTKQTFRVVTEQQTEDFLKETSSLKREYMDTGPGISGNLDKGLELVTVYSKKIDEAHKRKAELANARGLFGLDLVAYPDLSWVATDLGRLKRIYLLYQEQRDFQDSCSGTLWGDLNIKELQEGSEAIEKKSRKFPEDLKEVAIYKDVDSTISAFKNSLPLIIALKTDAMLPRHWARLMEVTGTVFEYNPKTLTLEAIFAMNLARFQEQIEEIVNEAGQELKISTEIAKIEAHWTHVELTMEAYTKDGKDRGFLLIPKEETKLELEDTLLNLQTIAGSRFVGEFAGEVHNWDKCLNLVNECLDMWTTTQRKWQYLESIFIGAEDIRLQLPEEAKKFDVIDKQFIAIMKATNSDRNTVRACTTEDRFTTLSELSDRLDKSQKSLTDYLDTKRNAFARFFFISADELLSILGSSDPTSIQVHMLKLFDNVKLLHFGRSGRTVVGQESSEKEKYGFVTPSPIEGPVEVWMTAVENEMKDSLLTITKAGVYAYAHEPRTEWLKNQIGMVCLVGSQIFWTYAVEDAFRAVKRGEKHAIKNLAVKLTGELNDMVRMVRTNLDKNLRSKVNTMLILDVHGRDIVDMFVRESVLNAKEFAWESQLRFYWDRDIDNCLIRQCTGSFQYGYEYMGLNGRLVITELTDRCYMTLTQALTFKLGGAPAGPAGTGKTETVKDLAKSMALPCFVINCGDGLDYKAMASIFAGLVQVGAWGCFDEFNRINIEVLSVVSAQLKAIQNAIVFDQETADIGMSNPIRVKRVAGFATCGFFITMNPGYAGRTELPDNLQALFRPVMMMVPDLRMISEIMLFSEGFESAKDLAKKMAVLYDLSKSVLSKQFHYDFGLRTLKTVLVLAGGLKRQYAQLDERIVLMRVLRDSNMPKFTFEDVPLFMGMIQDLFPGLDCPRVAFEALSDALGGYFESNGYKSDAEVFDFQVNKALQVYETQTVRHTTQIVGPTGGGKTLIIDALAAARGTAQNVTVKQWVINPKAQPLHQLYGFMDPETRDWTDGVLSRIFRDLNQPLPQGRENEMRWIVYDGDVDALWVENMNSVMDDNKLLTLPNGERIRLQPHCAQLIEVYDLQYASPATVSRCGMVWVDPKNLGYRPFYERWVKQRCGDGRVVDNANTDEATRLIELYDCYVSQSIELILKGIVNGEAGKKLEMIIPVTDIDLVKQLCCAIDAMWPSPAIRASTPENSFDGPVAYDKSVLDGVFLFAATWSLGASLTTANRGRFDTFLKKLGQSGGGGDFPRDGTLYDNVFDVERQEWENWKDRVPDYVQPSPFRFFDIMVPTVDSVLYTFLLKKLASHRPILFVGESGTAKTLTIQNYMSSLDRERNILLTLKLSSRTTSRDVQTNIDSIIDKRSGAIYGPPAGKRLVLFIDDMNMPKLDAYGTQQPLTWLQTLMSRGFFYDRDKDLNQKIIKDLDYIAAMGPPGGGRNPITPRIYALFNVINVTDPSEACLEGILTSILTTKFSDFTSGVKEGISKIPKTLLKIFAEVVHNLPPTPTKFHYIFNLRDLARVTEGLCLSTVDKCRSEEDIARYFRNEATRVFCDRLATVADNELVSKTIATAISSSFSGSAAEHALVDPMVFGDFAYAKQRLVEDKEDPRLYSDLGAYEDIKKTFDDILDFYNSESAKKLMLVLFDMALEHITRIMRIIRMPRGHALLIGVGGSGKQSNVQLASFCAGYQVFTVALSRGYNELTFRDDLKVLYSELFDKPTTFLFTDAHVVEEGFLESINNILNTGMVPALFEKDEIDAIVNKYRKDAKAHDPNCVTGPQVFQYWQLKCRDNLHVVLAMSPSGDKLRIRCRNFPGLVSNCVIDWFFSWPEDALKKVATFLLGDVMLPDEHRDNIIAHLVKSHTTVIEKSTAYKVEQRRFYYVTPKNYLDLISNYRNQLNINRKKNGSSITRLEGGLTKLVEAAEAVSRMQVELADKMVVVNAKTIDVEALIVDITAKTKVADEQAAVAAEKQVAAEEQSRVIIEEKGKADAALNEALPAVAAAAAALENLEKKDLDEIKNFAKPPELVMAVCYQVVCLAPTGEKLSENWVDAKKMLGNGHLLDLLKNYPKDKITSKQISGVKKYFKQYPNLTVENMGSVSKAGKGLLTWVDAISKYYDVARNVEPLRNKVKEMEKAQAKTEAELSSLNEMLGNLKSELAVLNTNFSAANGELSDLQATAATMEKRLDAASKLITGLTGERTRWTADIVALKEGRGRLVGDCLLTAAFISYAGAFSADYRQECINLDAADIIEKSLPVTIPTKVETLLVTEATVQGWNSDGLPADDNSVQNGILTTSASRFPLCIDPQQQAVNWIKRSNAKTGLTVKTLNESDFMKHLELAIQFGKAFLFENVGEELDPMLDPILEKAVTVEGGAKTIQLGDKKIDWDDNFRLFLTTKLANPHYSPEVMGKTMIINYCVTMDGLSNQLLNVVVGHERADLEAQFSQLVTEMGESALLIVNLEDTLLHLLSSSTGNILDNAELITTLEETKTKAVEISAKLEEATHARDEISRARSAYTPVAKRGSILYFGLAGLAIIDSMYESSLDSYLGVFVGALDASKKDVVLANRLRNMTTTITEKLYDYTCLGIFERHKLMFSFQMVSMILDGDGQLDRPALSFFLKGDTSLDEVAKPKPASVPWLSNSGWKDLIKLTGEGASKPLRSLLDRFLSNPEPFKQWYDLETPEIVSVPGDIVVEKGKEDENALSPMEKLCVIRCFRSDRAYSAVKQFIIHVMGEKFVQPPSPDIKLIHGQSAPTMPLVFILSPGADPGSDIQHLALELGFTGSKFRLCALGQGQGPVAEGMLDIGSKKGDWVLLQNCHLLASWLKRLEKILELMKSPHEDFRLWLTTAPTAAFPLGILQRALKVTTEPPDGLKLNMRATYAKIDETEFEECPHFAFRPCLFVLAFLHAVVLERRKYGKIGWNVKYSFNESDFLVSKKLISLYLTKAYEDGDEFIPWSSLKFLIGDAMYGGRVSDGLDRRILVTYLAEYMGDFLFDDCQKFFFSRQGFDYELPEWGELSQYTNMVESLPLVNGPAVFGLHPNAEIGYYSDATKSMWSDLVALQPKSGGAGGGMSREAYIDALAKDIRGKVPLVSMDIGQHDLIVVRELLKERNMLRPPTPQQVVLLQELERWNALVIRLASSLEDLVRALIGEIGMSDVLDALGDALFNGRFPDLYRKLAPDTEKQLGSWMSHFTRRQKQYEKWIEVGEPACMWLSGIHVPESYLTALIQATARARNWALDKSTLYTQVTKFQDANDVGEPLQYGSYICGLYLEGAAWDTKGMCLARQNPKELVKELPVMQVIPTEVSKLKLHNTFKTPCYITQSRRNAAGMGLAFEADLRSEEHESQWVLQGVALVLNTDT